MKWRKILLRFLLLGLVILAACISLLLFLSKETTRTAHPQQNQPEQTRSTKTSTSSSSRSKKSTSSVLDSTTSSNVSDVLETESSQSESTSVTEATDSKISKTELDKEEIVSHDDSGETEEDGTLTFKKVKQLYLKPLDHLGRASLAHIQLRDEDEPKIKRNSRINHDPVGWKNYKFYYNDGHKKAWLMHRGHLVGYQFSGIGEEPKNLVPMTAWLNEGNYTGMDSGNPDSMLFYENQLDNWLANHPNYWLDYQVRAIYDGDDLWPKQIELQYVGIDEKGVLIPIQLHADKESTDLYGITRVILDNMSPNATIDYTNGTAEETVRSARVQERARQAQEKVQVEGDEDNVSDETTSSLPEDGLPSFSEENASSTSEGDTQNPYVSNNSDGVSDETIVYVTGGGKSEVYWYSKDNMPYNTNMNNVIEMTKRQAELEGRRHSLNE